MRRIVDREISTATFRDADNFWIRRRRRRLRPCKWNI